MKRVRIHKKSHETDAGNNGNEPVRPDIKCFFEHGRQVANGAQLKIVAHTAEHIRSRLGTHCHKSKAYDAHMDKGVFHVIRIMEHPPLENQADKRRNGINSQSEYIDCSIGKNLEFREGFSEIVRLVHKSGDGFFKMYHYNRNNRDKNKREQTPGFYPEQGNKQKRNGIGMYKHCDEYDGEIRHPFFLFQIRESKGEDRHGDDLFDCRKRKHKGSERKKDKYAEREIFRIALDKADKAYL